MRPLSRSCFLLLLERFSWFALSFLEPAFRHCGVHFPPPLAPALIPLSLAMVRLSFTLVLSHLTIWWSVQTVLFLFFLAKTALASLPTALFVALRLLFPFRQVQLVQVFPLKPAPFCKLSADLGSTNKSAISLLLSYSCSVRVTLSSPPYFLLSQTSWQIWQEQSFLSSFTIRLQQIPGHSFLPGNNAADELA